MALGELADLVGGALEGGAATRITGVAGLDEAGRDQLSFCALPDYRAQVATTGAAAVIVPRDFERPPEARPDLALVRVDNPYMAVRAAVLRLHPEPTPAPTIHPSAVIAPDAELAEGVGVGAHAVVGDRARIGPRSHVGAGSVIGEGCRIGADCRLHANVTVYPGVRLGDRVIVHAGAVLGADGFGYATEGGRHHKIPQVGGLVIDDDVEVGANSCIDRAAMGLTRVARGTKIDNLVQIGHNCDVGADTILCGQVGLGGSTVIGNQVMVGGQAGFRGHLRVGDRAMIAGGSGVVGSVAAGDKVAGYPHMEASRWRRVVAAARALPELLRRVRRLETALADSRKENE